MSLIDVVQTNDNGQAAEYEVGTLVQRVIFIHQCVRHHNSENWPLHALKYTQLKLLIILIYYL
jgi:hypothetical protein